MSQNPGSPTVPGQVLEKGDESPAFPPAEDSAAPVITIDGPSGVGKGTLTQLLAARLQWHILDSGALYRLTGLRAHDEQIDLDNAEKVAEVALDLPVQFLTSEPGEPVSIVLAGEDVTHRIRSEDAGRFASRIAVHSPVRKALLARQRAFRQVPGLVADGRDMGTVVFPSADCKIFLTASAEVRAQRRYDQLLKRGESANIPHLLKEIEDRDARDMQRAEAPLRAADDAVIVDTSDLTIDAVLQNVLDVWERRST